MLGLYSEGGRGMKPAWEEFVEAYGVIMAYIDDEPDSRKVFHSLLTFRLNKEKQLQLAIYYDD